MFPQGVNPSPQILVSSFQSRHFPGQGFTLAKHHERVFGLRQGVIEASECRTDSVS